MYRAAWIVGLVSIVLSAVSADAEVISDTSTGTIVTPNGNVFDITGGTTVGGRNLFHSFDQLSVPTQGVANFLNDPSIVNIFSRVTGGRVSEIDGVLRSRGSANFFLMNPSGIVFGQNASLDVGGSFVGTTASAIRFSSGAILSLVSSIDSQNSLLTVDPSAFLFNQLPIGQIINNSNEPTGFTSPSGIPISGLRVPNGQSLLLVGGDINMNSGRLNALGGRIELSGLAELGSIQLTITGNTLSLSIPTNRLLSDITLTNDARIAVRGNGSGEAVFNANQMIATDGARIAAGTEGAGDAGNVIVNAKELDLSGIGVSGLPSSLSSQVAPNASGNAGNIIVNVSSFKASSGAGIFNTVLANAKGNAGDIKISANSILLTSDGAIKAETFGSGRGGNITLVTKRLIANDGGQISSSSGRQNAPGLFGRGGNIFIKAADEISIDATEIVPRDNRSGIFSETSSQNRAGDISINTRNLKILNGGAISSAAVRGGSLGGDSGIVEINASELIELRGREATGLRRSSFIGTEGQLDFEALVTFGFDAIDPVNAGDLKITSGQLVLSNGALISSSNLSIGNSGNILIQARDRIELANEATIASKVIPNGNGSGGRITLSTDSVSLSGRSEISAQNEGRGVAGDITINARKIVNVSNSQIKTTAEEREGGNISITAERGTILLRQQSGIRTDLTRGQGSGGNVTLTAAAIVALENSDILAFAPEGKGGRITFNTRAFLSNPLYRSTRSTTNRDVLNTLLDNGQVDVNASGVVNGAIVGVPDITFLQNSLTQLSQTAIDTNTLLANSCIARNQQNGSFYITGTGGLPTHPGELPTYSTGTVQPVTSTSSWKQGDAIVEPQGIYQLPDGQLVLSRDCSQ